MPDISKRSSLWDASLPSETSDEPTSSSLAYDAILHDDSSPESITKLSENQINRMRLEWFRSHYSSVFLRLVYDTELEYGFSSILDEFVEQRMAENALATMAWPSDLFIEHIADIRVTTGILRTLAHFSYQEVGSFGTTIATTATRHGSVRVKECALRAFESWASPGAYKFLSSLSFPDIPWMQEYLDVVLSGLMRG